MAACRACSARIRWVKTHAGKAMPVDPDPHPLGNVQIVDGEAFVLGAERVEEARGKNVPLYMAHFATCPNYERR